MSLQQKQQKQQRERCIPWEAEKCYQQDILKEEACSRCGDMRGCPGNSRNTWMDFWKKESKVWGTVVLKMKVTGQQNLMINVNTTWLVTTKMHVLRLIELHLANMSALNLTQTLWEYYPLWGIIAILPGLEGPEFQRKYVTQLGPSQRTKGIWSPYPAFHCFFKKMS